MDPRIKKFLASATRTWASWLYLTIVACALGWAFWSTMYQTTPGDANLAMVIPMLMTVPSSLVTVTIATLALTPMSFIPGMQVLGMAGTAIAIMIAALMNAIALNYFLDYLSRVARNIATRSEPGGIA